MVTVMDIMEAMATRIADVPGVTSAYATPPNNLEDSDMPAVVLFWDRTRVRPDTDGFMWLPTIKAQVMIAREGDTPEEFESVWSLIMPIVNSFTSGPVSDLLPGLDGHVDRIGPSPDREIDPTLLIGYAGMLYFGAHIYFDCKFHSYEGAP